MRQCGWRLVFVYLQGCVCIRLSGPFVHASAYGRLSEDAGNNKRLWETDIILHSTTWAATMMENEISSLLTWGPACIGRWGHTGPGHSSKTWWGPWLWHSGIPPFASGTSSAAYWIERWILELQAWRYKAELLSPWKEICLRAAQRDSSRVV